MDHGSYYVLGNIEAQKSIKLLGNGFSIQDDKGGALDGIAVNLKEYDNYKILTLIQIFTGTGQNLDIIKFVPFSYWKGMSWTTISDSTDLESPKSLIGNKSYTNLDFEDSTLKRIPSKTLNDYFYKKKLSEKNFHFFISLVNNNPLIGDLKHEELTFLKGKESDILMLKIETKIIKGQNVNTFQNNKVLHIPLRKSGKTYLVTIKFGKITKTYVLDSGASDMSIDEETFNYFENSNQLKIENRLNNAKYQLADGSIVELRRVRVPSLLINDILIKNIDATIVQDGKPLLLGKSFLDSFKSWKIDNETQTLIIELF